MLLSAVVLLSCSAPTCIFAQDSDTPRLRAPLQSQYGATPHDPGDRAPVIDSSDFQRIETDEGSSNFHALTPLEEVFGDELDLTPTFHIRGRIEVDAIRAAQSAQSEAMLGNLQNGYGFRRVRLGAFGNIGDAASWISEVELAGNNVRLRDVFIGLETIPSVRQLRVGQFREPYSLEAMTSSNFLTFMERGPTNVLSPARNWGVCGYWWPDDETWLFTLGVFRDGTQSSGQSLGDDESWAYTGRLTGLLIYEPDAENFTLLHVGGAASQRRPPNDTIVFTPSAGSSLITVEDNPGTPFLPSLTFNTNSFQLYNLQAAAVYGPLSVQWEWMAADIQQINAGQVFTHGTYIYGSYFLTGEHRGYDRTRGSFSRVDVLRPMTRSRSHPDSGYGALEAAVRFSYLNMDSPNLPLDSNGLPAQTVLYEITTGLNWYLNSHLRIMFDYTAGMPDEIAFGSTVAHLFGVRTALYW